MVPESCETKPVACKLRNPWNIAGANVCHSTAPLVCLLQDGTSVEGWIRNASISGALIDTGARMATYTSLSVVLMSGQGSRRRMIELPACVVRIARGCIGVEWRDMAEPTLVGLLREAAGPTAGEIARDHAFG